MANLLHFTTNGGAFDMIPVLIAEHDNIIWLSFKQNTYG